MEEAEPIEETPTQAAQPKPQQPQYNDYNYDEYVKVPKTGDVSTNIIPAAIVSLIACAGATILIKKKSYNQ